MKTLEQVKSEIDEIKARFVDQTKGNYIQDPESKSAKVARKQIGVADKARLYLEKNPTKESCETQMSEVKRRLKIATDGFQQWLGSLTNSQRDKPLTALKAEYNTLMGVKKLNAQKQLLTYILS